MEITLVRGDITEQAVDAVVNAANSALLGGGGVDGAIHRRGGPEVLAACRELRATTYRDGLPAGQAVATTGGRMPVGHVIHAVGPVWSGGRMGEPELLASCYRTARNLAAENNLQSVAFPAISTGAYRFPGELAARIAVGTVVSEISAAARGINRVVFCCFSQESADHHINAFTELELA